MTATIASLTGANGVFGTGRAQHRHIAYAPNSGVWWAFWVDPASPSSLACAYSADLVTWTAAAALTLPKPLAGGNQTASYNGQADARNFGISLVAVGATDVLHVATCLYDSGAAQAQLYDCRATVTASAITWGTPTQAQVTATFWSPDGTAPVVAADGSYLINSGLPRFTGHNQGNETGEYNATKDTAASWTPGAWSHYEIETAGAETSSHAAFALSGGTTLWLWDLGDVDNAPTDIRWGKADIGGSTPTAASVYGSSVTCDGNDWGACRVSASDVHVVRRTGANTYAHRRFNGTSWSAGDAIPTQTSLAGGGLALGSNGTDVYLAVIDSAAGQAVRYVKWTSGGGWGAWTDLDATSAARSSLAAMQEASGAGKLAFVWCENPSGTNYNVRVAGVTLSSVVNGTATLGGTSGGVAATSTAAGVASAGSTAGGLTAASLAVGSATAGGTAGGLAATSTATGTATAGSTAGGALASPTATGAATLGGTSGGALATSRALGSATLGGTAGGILASNGAPGGGGAIALSAAARGAVALDAAARGAIAMSARARGAVALAAAPVS
jgi:hypothetical protein